MAVVIQVDRPLVESLRLHLEAQGFPAARVGDDRLEVLFPAAPTLFETAAELDEWRARTGAAAAAVVHLADRVAARPLRCASWISRRRGRAG